MTHHPDAAISSDDSTAAPKLPRKRPGELPDVASTLSLFADYQSGLTLREVAEKWGISYSTVYDRFRILGLPTRPGGPAPKQQEEYRKQTVEMHADYRTGMSVPEVAAKWGLTEKGLYYRFRKARFRLRRRRDAITAKAAEPQ